MDHKAIPYEFVSVNENLQRMRLDDGFAYRVKTGESSPPTAPRREKRFVDDDARAENEKAIADHAELMKTWTPTIYWTPPFVLPDRPTLKDVWNAIDGVSRKVDSVGKSLDLVDRQVAELRPPLKKVSIRDIETNGPGSSFPPLPKSNYVPEEAALHGGGHGWGRVRETLDDDDFDAAVERHYTCRRDTMRKLARAQRPVRKRLFDAFRAFVLELY